MREMRALPLIGMLAALTSAGGRNVRGRSVANGPVLNLGAPSFRRERTGSALGGFAARRNQRQRRKHARRTGRR